MCICVHARVSERYGGKVLVKFLARFIQGALTKKERLLATVSSGQVWFLPN